MFNFDCFDDEEPRQKCMFRGVSACSGFVPNGEVCNAHANIFGLHQETHDYLTAGGKRETRNVVHAITPYLDIPMFLSPTGQIQAPRIESFVEEIAAEHPGINKRIMKERLACAMEMTTKRPRKSDGWLERENTVIFVEDANGVVRTAEIFPLLHRKLLKFSLPSVTIRGENEQEICIPNIGILLNDNALQLDSYSLRILPRAKDSTLIKTEKANSIATPLVLVAIQSSGADQDTVVIQRERQ